MTNGNVPKGPREGIRPPCTETAASAARRIRCARLLRGGSMPPPSRSRPPVPSSPASSEESSLQSIFPGHITIMELPLSELMRLREDSEECTLEWVRNQVKEKSNLPPGQRPSVYPIRAIGDMGPGEIFCVIGDGKRYRVKNI